MLCIVGLARIAPPDRASVGVWGGVPGVCCGMGDWDGSETKFSEDLDALESLSRGDGAPLFLLGGSGEGEPLDLPGGGDSSELEGRKGGKLRGTVLSSVHLPFLDLVSRVKSVLPYLILVLMSPGFNPGAVLTDLA